jgi:hypothetical protein
VSWKVFVRRFDMDKSEIQRCASGFELRREVTKIATAAKGFARSTSPDGFEGYQYQFEVDVEVVPDIPYRERGEPMERVSAFLVNQSRLAVLVEVGGKNSENFRILTRTLKWIEMQAKVTP